MSRARPHLQVSCSKLSLSCHTSCHTYRPDPISNPGDQRKVELPEDKLKAGMKERLVASMVILHEATEKKVDEIYK